MTNLDDKRLKDLKFSETYLFNGAFRYPGIGMIVCPPEIPAEVFGMQLCFSLANDLNFTESWGPPNYRLSTAVIDYTCSDYNLIKIREALSQYYESINDTDEAVVSPEIYTFDNPNAPARHGAEESMNLVEAVERLITEKGIDCIFINGCSGFYDDSFYDCVARLKRVTANAGACIIITHVIGSVIYNDPKEALREPLSFNMIRPGHLEATALMDWTWFVATATQSVIKAVSQAEISSLPNGVSLYANKIIQPNKFISLSALQHEVDQKSQKPWNSLFYLYKSPAPVLFDVKLSSAK